MEAETISQAWEHYRTTGLKDLDDGTAASVHRYYLRGVVDCVNLIANAGKRDPDSVPIAMVAVISEATAAILTRHVIQEAKG